jgi:hypothetical protein
MVVKVAILTRIAKTDAKKFHNLIFQESQVLYKFQSNLIFQQHGPTVRRLLSSGCSFELKEN